MNEDKFNSAAAFRTGRLHARDMAANVLTGKARATTNG